VDLSNEQISHAEAQILRELDSEPGPRKPREVFESIRAEHWLSDTVLRAALWYLIDRNAIELTTDLRVLRRPQTAGQQSLLAT
jgi:hypothetical protein